MWDRYVYIESTGTAESTLSKPRAAVFSVVTILFIAMFTPTALGNAVRFFTLEPLIDASLMAVSKTTKEFYLNHSEEILPMEDIHSVRGCRKEGECREYDAAYFRVKPRLSHDVWKLFAHGDPIYIPDHVVAPIAPGVNRCQVTYYGYRMTSSWISRLMRSLQIYPVLLEANCEFLGSA